MLVFPPNPNRGAVFDPGGGLPTWMWDGEKWTNPSLPLLPPPLEITTATLPNAQMNVAYNTTLQATGGTPPYTWSKIGGTAEWASISSTGVVTGTPPASGAQNIVARVTDSRFKETDAVLDMTITAGPLAITTANFGPGLLTGVPMSVQLEATGGIPPYTWEERDAGAFAYFGLTLSPSGLVTGAPVMTANSNIFVRVTDSASTTTVPRNITLVIGQGPLAGIRVTSGGPLKSEYVNGENIPNTFFATIGGTAPFTWGTSGDKPSWITHSGTYIRGNIPPTFTGSVDFAITVSDSTSATASLPIQFEVVRGVLTITYPTQFQTSNIGTYFSESATVRGGTPPYTWTINGLPPGFWPGPNTPQTGIGWSFWGVPEEVGEYNVTITVTDAASGTDSITLPLTIGPPLPLTITPTSGTDLGTAYLDQPWAYYFSVSGGIPPYTWGWDGMIEWATFWDYGTGANLEGTPTWAPATYYISVWVTDSSDPPQTAIETGYMLTVESPGGDGEPPIYDQYHDGGVEEQKATPPTPTEALPKKPAPRKNATHRKSPPSRKKGK